MTAKERMIYALSDMLQNGETLMYSIYGLLVQGGRQYYGYFGFFHNTTAFLVLLYHTLEYFSIFTVKMV